MMKLLTCDMIFSSRMFFTNVIKGYETGKGDTRETFNLTLESFQISDGMFLRRTLLKYKKVCPDFGVHYWIHIGVGTLVSG